MISYLKDFLTPARVDIWLKSGVIEICSLETIRGRSWDYATVIVDESQNLYAEEVQALTTRIGEGSQMIFLGDDSGVQTDVKNKKDGLSYLLGIVDKYDIPNVGITYLGYEDILRHDIVREFVIAFDKEQIEEKERHAKNYRVSNRGRNEEEEDDDPFQRRNSYPMLYQIKLLVN